MYSKCFTVSHFYFYTQQCIVRMRYFLSAFCAPKECIIHSKESVSVCALQLNGRIQFTQSLSHALISRLSADSLISSTPRTTHAGSFSPKFLFRLTFQFVGLIDSDKFTLRLINRRQIMCIVIVPME